MNLEAVTAKYAQSTVVDYWYQLAQQGLQQCETIILQRYLPPQGSILDVGCGAGRVILALQRWGYDVHGMDLSLPMLRAGKQLDDNLSLSGGNLTDLPYAANSVDAMLMLFGALQHLPGRQTRCDALAEMSRVVKPGGRLILGLDNLAPALTCYIYWLFAFRRKRRLLGSDGFRASSQPTNADVALWKRRTHPLVWHARGLARTLHWRTWAGIVDFVRWLWPFPIQIEPGDTRVAQFSVPSTPQAIYYHVYRAEALIDEAKQNGWQLLGYHCLSELNEGNVYPDCIRQHDKLLFFAFQKVGE